MESKDKTQYFEEVRLLDQLDSVFKKSIECIINFENKFKKAMEGKF